MKFAALLLICVLFGSCFDDGNCLITATNYMRIQFKKKANNKLDTALALTTVFVSGTPPDSVLTINASTNDILIPLDIHTTVTTFVLQHTDPSSPTLPASDTLQINYTAQSKIIDKECGAFTYYQNLKIVKTNLKDSQIKALNTSLLKDPTIAGNSGYAVNYQIFY